MLSGKRQNAKWYVHYNYSHHKQPVLLDDDWAIMGKDTKICIQIVEF